MHNSRVPHGDSLGWENSKNAQLFWFSLDNTYSKTFQKRKKHVFVKSVIKIFEFQKSNSMKIPQIYRLILCENLKVLALEKKNLFFSPKMP